MKIKITISIFILSLGSYTKAQNLVLNPSFEQHTNCPTAESQINYCNSWNNGDALGTVDYYSANGCTGNFSPPYIKPVSYLTWYQQPLSGESFAAFIPFYGQGANPLGVEYAQGKFNIPLGASQLYYVEFYINAASQQEYCIHDIAALITDTSGFVNTSNLLNYHPQILPVSNVIYQDTVRWMRIKGYYVANGGENYITIGNYTPYGHELKDSVPSPYKVAYYFIDSVGVYPVTQWDSWNAGVDKYITLGDSAQIGNPSSDYSMFSWVTSTGGITYLSDSTMPQIWSKPPATTTYYVTKTQGINIIQDTVTVYITNPAGISKVGNNNLGINIYPNPSNNIINVAAKEIVEIKLYDLLGNEILSQKENEIDVSGLANGIYFVQLNTQGNTYTQKIIVQH